MTDDRTIDLDEPEETGPTYAVMVVRDGLGWQVGALPEVLTDDLDALVSATRQQPDGSFALVDVEGDFFVAVRVHSGQLRLLLSDAAAAVAGDLGAQVCEALDVDVPEDDEDTVPVGDLAIFSDLGLDEEELAFILADPDAYADEMLSTLAERLGFAEVYEPAVDALVG